jgi:hypothetical protein
MAKSPEAQAREERQGRVAKVVWGVTFMVMGALFSLDNMGRLDMGDTRRYVPSHAVDGDPETRWSSSFHENQWIRVDLGTPAEITKVKLNWEAAYAIGYRIEVSDDDTSWKTILEVTNGKGGIDEQDVSARGRYLRVFSTKRATPYGISLWELEVYGTPLDAGPATVASVGLLSHGRSTTASSTERTSYWFLYWPVALIATALPGLIAPKNSGDQVFALCMVGAGVYFQLQTLRLVSWRFSQVWPILLVLAGFLLVSQSWGRFGKDRTPDGGAGFGMGG